MPARKPNTKSTRTSSVRTKAKKIPSKSRTASGTASTKSTARTTLSGPARSDIAAQADMLVAKMEATQALAAQMPFNRTKEAEYGEQAASPPQGASNAPADPSVGASTLTETNASDKTGTGAPPSG